MPRAAPSMAPKTSPGWPARGSATSPSEAPMAMAANHQNWLGVSRSR